MIHSIKTIHTGYFKLDGGAMFGVVPKTLWSKLNPPDEQNFCTWSLRCLLIEMENKRILVDCGMGNKQDDKFRSFFQPHGNTDLLNVLAQDSIMPEDITDVFLTHLHFDHCGGAVSKDSEGNLIPTFPNAVYWSNERHWDWAINPNERERASFLKENFIPLQQQSKIKFIESDKTYLEWLPGIVIRFSYGHTEAMMTLEMEWNDQKYVYCADLLPSSFHIGLPYIMAYDVRPLVSLQEKEFLLRQAVDHNHILILEHDPIAPAVTVKYDERNRIVMDRIVQL